MFREVFVPATLLPGVPEESFPFALFWYCINSRGRLDTAFEHFVVVSTLREC